MRKWFDVSEMEEKGFWALNILLLLVVCWRLYGHFLPLSTHEDQEFAKQDSITRILQSKIAQLDSLYSASPKKALNLAIESSSKADNRGKNLTKDLFPFDPNELTLDSLLLLGFSSTQAKNLVAYREAGGHYSEMDDLAKIYGMDPELLNSLGAYIQFPRREKVANPQKTKTLQAFDINTADTAAFMQISGIGSTYAKRIIAFREKLGGFHSKTQLFEVWGLDSALVKSNWNLFQIGNKALRKLNINSMTAKELAKHPYLNWKQAKSIVALREQHGPFEEPKDILKSVLI
ncbi:MAG: helix-hairpin-helix domain-containing protein, partial [Luteibaculum sp.]